MIENAIKFSPENSIIHITLKNVLNSVEFSVKDEGTGISQELHDKIFEPYYQIGHKKDNRQGLGLGLSIVKKVVDDLKGSINIISYPTKVKGTEILIKLKQHIANKNAPLIAGVLLKPSISISKEFDIKDAYFNVEKETILIVEDNISLLDYLAKKLRKKYNCYVAVNGNAAIKKLKEMQTLPDLIITDIMMDKMDGYEFAKFISANKSYLHIPFIFITAKNALTDKLQGLQLGAIDYVFKPFYFSELIQKIDSLLLFIKKQNKAVFNKAFSTLNLNNQFPINESSTKNFEQNCDLYNFTKREKEIATLICQGQKYKDIGQRLYIAERTVTKHAQNMFDKTQVSNKIEFINKLEL